jgi:hypothetical protein
MRCGSRLIEALGVIGGPCACHGRHHPGCLPSAHFLQHSHTRSHRVTQQACHACYLCQLKHPTHHTIVCSGGQGQPHHPYHDTHCQAIISQSSTITQAHSPPVIPTTTSLCISSHCMVARPPYPSVPRLPRELYP